MVCTITHRGSGTLYAHGVPRTSEIAHFHAEWLNWDRMLIRIRRHEACECGYCIRQTTQETTYNEGLTHEEAWWHPKTVALLSHIWTGKNQIRRVHKPGMNVDQHQGDEWGITGVQKVRVEFGEHWAKGFTTDVEDGHLIKVLNQELSVEPPNHGEGSGMFQAKRTQTGWTIKLSWLYDRGNKEETTSFDVDDISVQILE